MARRRLSQEQRLVNEQIERDLAEAGRRREREHRILLLGCGEAGKSTLVKQMRVMHSDGFPEEERMVYKWVRLL